MNDDGLLKAVLVLMFLITAVAFGVTIAVFAGPVLIVGYVAYRLVNWHVNKPKKVSTVSLAPIDGTEFFLDGLFEYLKDEDVPLPNIEVGTDFLRIFNKVYQNNRAKITSPEKEHAFYLGMIACTYGVAKALPPFASRQETSPFKLPLHQVVTETPQKFLYNMVHPIFDDDIAKQGFFQEERDRIRKNEAKHGEIEKFRGTAEETHRAYLAGTFFTDYLNVPIPFPLTSYKNKHWAIYGRTGHGKSQLLQTIVLSHMKEADPPAMIIMDSQGQLLKTIEDRYADTDRLVIVDAQSETPPALNLFATPKLDEEGETEILNLYNYIFSALDADLTRRQSTLFTFITRVMLKKPGATLLDLIKLLEEGKGNRNFGARSSSFWPVMEQLDDVDRRFFETRFFETSSAPTKEQIVGRLYSLLAVKQVGRMFNAPTNKLNLLEAISKKKTVLINTAGLGEWTTLFGRTMVASCLQAAYQRDIRNEPEPALLFIDEAFDLMDDRVNNLLIRARKYGLFIRFFTQQYDQIPPDVRAAAAANTEVKLAGGLSARDCASLSGDMRTTSEFLLSTRKHANSTEFACHVQNELDRAVRLSIPFGLLEAEPKVGTPARARALRASLADIDRTAEAPMPKASEAAGETATPNTATKKNFPTEW